MSKDHHLEGHILTLIRTHDIAEQSVLQDYLKERGYEIPQATLSRKLRKLNIAKVSGVYQIVDYQTPHLPLILNIQVSDFGMVVLHTHPGHANGLAYYFDQKYVSYSGKETPDSLILGTIAGDDTVLLIVKNKAKLKALGDRLRQDFPYLPNDVF